MSPSLTRFARFKQERRVRRALRSASHAPSARLSPIIVDLVQRFGGDALTEIATFSAARATVVFEVGMPAVIAAIRIESDLKSLGLGIARIISACGSKSEEHDLVGMLNAVQPLFFQFGISPFVAISEACRESSPRVLKCMADHRELLRFGIDPVVTISEACHESTLRLVLCLLCNEEQLVDHFGIDPFVKMVWQARGYDALEILRPAFSNFSAVGAKGWHGAFCADRSRRRQVR